MSQCFYCASQFSTWCYSRAHDNSNLDHLKTTAGQLMPPSSSLTKRSLTLPRYTWTASVTGFASSPFLSLSASCQAIILARVNPAKNFLLMFLCVFIDIFSLVFDLVQRFLLRNLPPLPFIWLVFGTLDSARRWQLQATLRNHNTISKQRVQQLTHQQLIGAR